MMTQPLVEKLADAREAYHDLMTGKAVRVVVDANGERVEFTAANRQALYSYIQQLAAQVESESSATTVRASSPVRFLF